MAYQVAQTILGRLKNYLMTGPDDSTTSPGTIAIGQSAPTILPDGTIQPQPPLPIFICDY
jgi:hypothetical protein